MALINVEILSSEDKKVIKQEALRALTAVLVTAATAAALTAIANKLGKGV